MNRNGRRLALLIWMALLTTATTGCTWFDKIHLRVDPVWNPPPDAHAIAVTRDGDTVRVTWKGATAVYDVEDSYLEVAQRGRWSAPRLTELRPADTADGMYFCEFPASDRAQRFRVRSVQVEERSEWSRWVEIEPEIEPDIEPEIEIEPPSQ